MLKIEKSISSQKVLYQEKLSKEEIQSIQKSLHTTSLGEVRIKKNLGLECVKVIEFCKSLIQNEKCNVYKQGKNYYFELDNIKLTVNAKSFTVITAHKIR